MKTQNRLCLTVIALFIILPFPGLTAQTDLSEGWEISAMERQPPSKVLPAMGIKQGMVIGEIGAGRGRYTVYFAREVGPTGKIYANDIDERALTYLKSRCTRLGFNNVETISGKMDDPLFPDNSLDMAVMVWVYHMVDKPDGLLKNLLPSLKPGATLAILDPVDKEIDEEFNIDRSKPDVKIPTIKERIEKSAKEAGYELIKVDSFLPRDHIFILKPK